MTINLEARDINFKYILLMAMLYVTISLAADAVAYKLVAFGGALLPGPPFIFPITYLLSDIIAEVYGYNISKKIIWLGLICEIIFAVAVWLLIKLPAPNFWHDQIAFQTVFEKMPRFVFAGCIAVLASNFMNIYAVAKWKIMFKGKKFWLRSIGASSLGGFVLVVATVFIGYSGTINLADTFRMMISVYLIELFYTFVLAIPADFLTKFMKYVEQSDPYDINTNFNPLNFK